MRASESNLTVHFDKSELLDLVIPTHGKEDAFIKCEIKDDSSLKKLLRIGASRKAFFANFYFNNELHFATGKFYKTPANKNVTDSNKVKIQLLQVKKRVNVYNRNVLEK